jgi:hypothetical protein
MLQNGIKNNKNTLLSSASSSITSNSSSSSSSTSTSTSPYSADKKSEITTSSIVISNNSLMNSLNQSKQSKRYNSPAADSNWSSNISVRSNISTNSDTTNDQTTPFHSVISLNNTRNSITTNYTDTSMSNSNNTNRFNQRKDCKFTLQANSPLLNSNKMSQSSFNINKKTNKLLTVNPNDIKDKDNNLNSDDEDEDDNNNYKMRTNRRNSERTLINESIKDINKIATTKHKVKIERPTTTRSLPTTERSTVIKNKNQNQNQKASTKTPSKPSSSSQFPTIQKTKLDNSFDYSIDSFTTRFEILGNPSNHLKLPPNNSCNTINNNNNTDQLTTLSPSHIKADDFFLFNEDENETNQSNTSLLKEHKLDIKTVNDSIIKTTTTTPPPPPTDSIKNKINNEKLTPQPQPPPQLQLQLQPQISNNYRANFHRITDYLYTGSMSCIKNERKMCRLGIDNIIDMTNMRPDDLNRRTLGKMPCLCVKPHSRLHMAIQIDDTDFKSLFNTFSEINRFIQRARKSSSSSSSSSTQTTTTTSKAQFNILIIGKDSLGQQVVCACAQYLMLEYAMNLQTALNEILQTQHNTEKFQMDKSYTDYLEQFEIYLGQMLNIQLLNSKCFILKNKRAS